MNPTQTAAELDAEGKCIICRVPRKSRRRGLCVKHYEQFRRKKESLSPEDAAAWEDLVVEAGKLLPSRQGARASGEDDAFADLFTKFKATGVQRASEIASSPDDEAIGENMDRVSRREATRKKATDQAKSGRKKKSG